MLGSQVTAHAAVVTERSGKNIESEIGWGHEYVITSLLENAVSWKINEGGRQSEATLNLPSSTPTRHVCLGGAKVHLPHAAEP